MSDDIKKQLGAVIDSYKEDLCQMSDEIFDLAEISGEEYKPPAPPRRPPAPEGPAVERV